MLFGGTGDRHYPWRFRQQPRQGNLRRGHPLLSGEALHHIDELLIRQPRGFAKTRHLITEVLRIERGLCVNRAGQKTFPERAEGDKADIQLSQKR